jgi:prevent-host-death family protein
VILEVIMEMSIREAKAKFSEAIAAAARGERVVVTKYGVEIAEIRGISPRKGALDFEAADRYLESIGWKPGSIHLPDNFDDPAFSRQVLGLDD